MQDSSAKISFLGHASVQIDAGGVRLVIDPNFGTRIAAFMNRHEAAVFDPLELHATDAVLFSNPRFNRLHHHSLKYFKLRRAKLFVPPGTAAGIRRFYGFPMSEMAANAPASVGGVTITAFPSPHSSWRFFKRHGVSLNFLIRAPEATIFYGSDMRYDQGFFARIGEAHAIDAAILPIDHVGADFVAKNRFLTVTDALAALKDLKARTLIPNAFGAFAWQGRDPFAAKRELEIRVAGDETLRQKVKILIPGESFEVKSPSGDSAASAAPSMGEVLPLKTRQS